MQLITECECDMVLNAIVGSAGLVPTVAALGEGVDLALANKESLVVGGELVTQLAEATGLRSSPWTPSTRRCISCSPGEAAGTVDRLVLTASGGPFRGMGAGELENVSVEQALAHPTWAMGGKITIDSATLMNKGLELIEAHYLFGTPYEQIDVVVHPQSIIHSLIQLCDGSTLAHLGYPDMRVPISYALNYPQRVDVPVRPLDLVALGSMTFEAPDEETFRCLRLAREAARVGGHGAVRDECRQRGRGARVPERADPLPGHRRGDRGDPGGAARRAGPLVRFALRRGRPGPTHLRRAGGGAGAGLRRFFEGANSPLPH